jgi:hypothetical protein
LRELGFYTYIHRVNSGDGVAPTTDGLSIGVSVEVPYTAEDYLYRAKD